MYHYFSSLLTLKALTQVNSEDQKTHVTLTVLLSPSNYNDTTVAMILLDY